MDELYKPDCNKHKDTETMYTVGTALKLCINTSACVCIMQLICDCGA